MKKIRICLLLCLLACLCPKASVSGSRIYNYFVSTSGDDHNPGTRDQPWKTIARANETPLEAHIGLWFQGGQTFSGSLVLDGKGYPGSALFPIVIGSYGKGRATIQAGDSTAILARNLGHVHVQDLIVTGSRRETNHGSGVKIVNDLPGGVRLHDIRIENVDASRFGQEGIFVGGTPADGSQSGYEGVQIVRCDGHDNVHYGIYVTGAWDERAKTYANADVTIAHCRAYDNPGDPLYLDNHSGNGILLDDTDGGVIDRCVAWGNGALCNCPKGGPVGIWAHAANRITIQNCESYNNRTGRSVDGGGFDFDGGVSNSVMQYNYSHGNDGAGFLLYVYAGAPHSFHDNLCRFNISENDGRKNGYPGIFVGNDGSGVSHIQVYQNTVYMGESSVGTPQAVRVYGTTDVSFRNNIFVTAGRATMIEARANQRNLIFQGNLYWSGHSPLTIQYAATQYDALDAWRTATHQETDGAAPTGLQADPRLTMPGRGLVVGEAGKLSHLTAYRLLPASPAAHAGLDLRGRFVEDTGPQDFFGHSLPAGPPSIGADAH